MSKQNIKEIKETLDRVIKLAKQDKEVHSLLKKLFEISSKPFPKESSKETILEEESESEINPIEIFTQGGEDGLLKALEPLSPSQLINIIKRFGFDPSRKSYRWRKKERLIELIAQRIKSSTSRGDVFK